jgi:hypothetical protein
MKDYVAIDPMAMILTEDAFLIWCEIHHPHVPKLAEIKQLFEHMTQDQKTLAASRAKTLARYGEMLVECGKAVENAGRQT